MEHYAGDRRVAWNTTAIPHPYPPGGAAAFIAQLDPSDERVWAITANTSKREELVGAVSLRANNQIGYWIGVPFWSVGYATEAVGAIVAQAGREGIGALTASVFQDNPASARLLVKNGFAHVGEETAFSIARGAVVDCWSYRLDRSGQGV